MITNDSSIPYRNKSGCADPTAHDALSAIQAEQDQEVERVNRLIKALKINIDLADFDLLNRIEIRDRRTGKCYR